MAYMPVKKILDQIKQTAQSQNEIEEAIAVEVLLRTAQEKLQDLGGFDLQFFVPSKVVMEASLDPISSDIAHSEITRLLLIYDFEKQSGNPPTVKDVTTYKVEDPNRDDVTNEKRVIDRLEEKGLIEVRRNSETDSKNELQLNAIGKELIGVYLYNSEALIELFNRSRNQKIREFLVRYIDEAQKTQEYS